MEIIHERICLVRVRMFRYNGVEIEDTFAETLCRVDISPANPLF